MRNTQPGWRARSLPALLVGVWCAAGAVNASAQPGAPPASPDMQQAADLLRKGDTDGALAAVRRELAASPTSTRAANMLDTLGANTEARQVFQRIRRRRRS
jgi:hypothetical protein